MPIEKTTATILRKEEKPYESINRQTVQDIRQAEALAIWIYLQCKPMNWVIRKKDIMQSLNIGEDRYRKGMNYLKGIGLITIANMRDDTGKFQGKVIWCHSEAEEVQNRISGNQATEIIENPNKGNPHHGETSSLKDIQSNKDLQTTKVLSGKPDSPSPKNNFLQEAKAVLQFLNEKTGRNYQPVKANLDLIRNRLKEGATITDCRQIIAKKNREWATDDKMSAYLRPATLFCARNFWQYQGELVEVENG